MIAKCCLVLTISGNRNLFDPSVHNVVLNFPKIFFKLPVNRINYGLFATELNVGSWNCETDATESGASTHGLNWTNKSPNFISAKKPFFAATGNCSFLQSSSDIRFSRDSLKLGDSHTSIFILIVNDSLILIVHYVRR